MELEGAILSGADLSQADLSGADLTGADLAGADLAGANLEEVKQDGETIWPSDPELNSIEIESSDSEEEEGS